MTLKDCLHAPEIPINLLSVGSMVENDLKLIFEKDATSITFPKSPALKNERIKASWSLKSGNQVKVVRSDGAGKFTDGALGEYMASKGITHQTTAPYAHQQNGKA
ncbi:hypothetical protein C0993_012392, partial [Termitomyces sp. T159_Od127]